MLLAGLMAAAPSQAGAIGPTVLRDVRASSADIPLGRVHLPIGANDPQPDTQVEPSIAVNPGDPRNVVAAFQEDRVASGGDAGNGFATSFDGGRTWTHGFLPGLTRLTHGPFDRASDAVVTFGADPDRPGHYLAYANSLVFNDGSGPSGDTNQSGMAVNVSKDGGRTWSKAVIIQQDGLAGLNDKNWIVADNGTGTGHTTGRVYVMWDRIDPMIYVYCDAHCDKAASWSSIGNLSFYPFSPLAGIGSIPLVLPDGSLGVVFEGDFGGTPSVPSTPTDQPEFAVAGSQLQYAVAVGAGATVWPAPLPFPQATTGIAANQANPVAEQRAGTLPAAAVNPRTGQLYVAWEDGRYRTDGLNDIVVSTSANGITWSAPARVNTGTAGDHVDHWNAMIDVGRDGVVHVGYRQRDERQHGPTNRSVNGLSPSIDTYYQESRDGGRTWTAPLRVNRERTDVGYAAFSRGGAFLGDYNQLVAATNGWTYLVHNEALPRTPGEACNCSFTRGNGHQHQYTYVGVIARASAPTPGAGGAGSGSGGSGGGSGSAGGNNTAGGTHGLARTGVPAGLAALGLALLGLAAVLHRRPRTWC